MAYLGWFSGHLDAGLQDGDGELRVRGGREPEAEFRMGLLHLELFHQLVQLRHPGQRQVAVGQEHPVTLDTDTLSVTLDTDGTFSLFGFYLLFNSICSTVQL